MKILLAALTLVGALFAQETTVARLYLMPMTVQQTPIGSLVLPKYRSTFTTPTGQLQYGSRLVALVAAETTTQVHNALVANADVYAFPDGFQTGAGTVSGGTRTSLQNTLESFGIPATWITNGTTYRSYEPLTGR